MPGGEEVRGFGVEELGVGVPIDEQTLVVYLRVPPLRRQMIETGAEGVVCLAPPFFARQVPQWEE